MAQSTLCNSSHDRSQSKSSQDEVSTATSLAVRASVSSAFMAA